jgi:hypothetical protein
MRISIIFFLLLFFAGCKNSEEKVFPIEPYIEFKSLEFKKGSLGWLDTLDLKFYFRDGDSDLGLDASSAEPYNFRNYFFKANGKKYTGGLNSNNIVSLITYRDKRILKIDTLPKFQTPFDCNNWEVFKGENPLSIDTIYYQANKNYYNIFVALELFDGTGWKAFNPSLEFTYPNCVYDFLNGRFPPLENFVSKSNLSFELEKISNKEGLLKYRIMSSAFQLLFKGKKIKLKVSIQDRALHKSNEIETAELQF